MDAASGGMGRLVGLGTRITEATDRVSGRQAVLLTALLRGETAYRLAATYAVSLTLAELDYLWFKKNYVTFNKLQFVEEFKLSFSKEDMLNYLHEVLLPRGIFAHQMRTYTEESLTAEALTTACSVLTKFEVRYYLVFSIYLLC